MSEFSTFLHRINSSWTLFLDRDGVINQRIYNGYATKIEEFILIDKVKEAFQLFRTIFGKIIVVTNQQGIGKGLMTEAQLTAVHMYMLKELKQIDKVYHSPYLASENHPFRKPNIGMAWQAKKDFPEIDFTKSVMVGDSYSDILFGQNAGMKTVFIGKEKQLSIQADMYADSLYEFACMLQK